MSKKVTYKKLKNSIVREIKHVDEMDIDKLRLDAKASLDIIKSAQIQLEGMEEKYSRLKSKQEAELQENIKKFEENYNAISEIVEGMKEVDDTIELLPELTDLENLPELDIEDLKD